VASQYEAEKTPKNRASKSVPVPFTIAAYRSWRYTNIDVATRIRCHVKHVQAIHFASPADNRDPEFPKLVHKLPLVDKTLQSRCDVLKDFRINHRACQCREGRR